MEGIPASLPSLLFASKVQRKAASLGLDTDAGAAPGIDSAGDLGDALFALVAAARRLDLDPEAVLRSRAAVLRDQVVAAGD